MVARMELYQAALCCLSMLQCVSVLLLALRELLRTCISLILCVCACVLEASRYIGDPSHMEKVACATGLLARHTRIYSFGESSQSLSEDETRRRGSSSTNDGDGNLGTYDDGLRSLSRLDWPNSVEDATAKSQYGKRCCASSTTPELVSLAIPVLVRAG